MANGQTSVFRELECVTFEIRHARMHSADRRQNTATVVGLQSDDAEKGKLVDG